MPAISIQDLENAKTDVDHIATVATSLDPTATDRLGHVKQTLAGAVGSIAAINDRGVWATGAAYLVKDLVWSAGTAYICVLGHTAGATFVGDSAKWRVYQGLLGSEFDQYVADVANQTDPAKGAALVGYEGRTQADKNTESYSIADAGGIGDGVTDNTAAIQAIEAGTKTYIYLPTGTYKYDGVAVTSLNKTYFGPGKLNDGSGVGIPRTSAIPFSANELFDHETSIDNAVVVRRKAANSTTRVYVMPKGSPPGKAKASIKLFFDDFRADPLNYRDFNLTAVDSGFVSGGTYSAYGALLLNLKTLGSYRSVDNPDIIFCYNDAISTNYIAGRIAYEHNSGNARLLWNFGQTVPDPSLPAVAVARFERDLVIENTFGVRWSGADGTYDWRMYLGNDDMIHVVANGVDVAQIDANGSYLTVNGTGLFRRARMVSQSIAYAASYTPNLNTGSSQKMHLTGAVTVNAPTNSVDGDLLELIFQADGSTRAITFNAAFKLGAYSASVTANTTNVYTFRNTGSGVWRLNAAPAIGV